MKKDFKLTSIAIRAAIPVLLLTLALSIWTNDWFIILLELWFIGLHVLYFFVLEFLVMEVRKK